MKSEKIKDFEEKAMAMINLLRKNARGLSDIKLYRNVEDFTEYIIYMEWENITELMEFPFYTYFKDIMEYGSKNVLIEKPKLRILG